MLKWPFGAGNKTAASAQSADQLVLEGNRAEKEGRLREARDLYRKAVAAAPNHGKARLNLGIALQALGDEQAAIAAYEAALAIDATDPLCQLQPGPIALCAGRPGGSGKIAARRAAGEARIPRGPGGPFQRL